MADTGSIVHVVLTEWREGMPAESRAEMRLAIGRFAEEIPGVLSVVEGPSVSTEGLESGFEWCLVATFADAAARDGYLDHPTHLPVAAIIGEWAARLVVFDLDG
ncbi:Dabb family protein [Demequina aestuarii]|uniref:Dabb family protein n=1 Tax=Demequina aestuarii TaxID=327095 RepID=UPI0007831559|nr:Dabb family protein [Demequina aestuarii]